MEDNNYVACRATTVELSFTNQDSLNYSIIKLLTLWWRQWGQRHKDNISAWLRKTNIFSEHLTCHGDGGDEEEATTSETRLLLTTCRALYSLATLKVLSVTPRKYWGYIVRGYHYTLETLIWRESNTSKAQKKTASKGYCSVLLVSVQSVCLLIWLIGLCGWKQ